MQLVLHDIEINYNEENHSGIFIDAIYDYIKGDFISVFEISHRKNQLKEIVDFFNKEIMVVGYNNLYFDDIIIHFLIKNYERLAKMQTSDIVKEIANLSDTIIESQKSDNNDSSLIGIWNKYKYNKPFHTVDLLAMHFSKKLRIGLKYAGICLNYPKIQEMPIHHKDHLSDEQIDMLIDYCKNDVLITKSIFEYSKKALTLRRNIKTELNVGWEVLSFDGIKLGNTVTARMICDELGITEKEFNKLRSEVTSVTGQEILLPFIRFNNQNLKELHKTLLERTYYTNEIEHQLKKEKEELEVIEDKIEKKKSKKDKIFELFITIDDLEYSIGYGGLHSINKPEIIIPPDDCYLIQSDVGGYYPSQIKMHQYYPKHIGVAFSNSISKSVDKRNIAKASGDTLSNELYKLANNGVFGQLNNKFSPFASIDVFLKVTMNGQLMLLMLVELIVNAGFKVISANTDAVNVIVPKNRYDEYITICEYWEYITKMKLDHEKFVKIVQEHINSYVAIYEKAGKIKVKGYFEQIRFGKGYKHPVVKKAVLDYFIKGITVEQTIFDCKEIYDFCMGTTVGKSSTKGIYKVMWGDKQTQNIVRYYACNSGEYLLKVRDAQINPGNILKDSKVMLFNDYFSVDNFEDYDVNYSFYIEEAYKMINKIEGGEKIKLKDFNSYAEKTQIKIKKQHLDCSNETNVCSEYHSINYLDKNTIIKKCGICNKTFITNLELKNIYDR